MHKPVEAVKNYTIYIPYHGSLDFSCDFIIQTACELIRKHYSVYLISYTDKWLSWQNTTISRFGCKINIISIGFVLPTLFFFQKFTSWINKVASTLILCRMIKHSQNPLLWCFSFEDYYLAKKAKPTARVIYDCVDYFTSIESNISRIIHREEIKLIQTTDYFFVNSRTLLRLKSLIRKDCHLVPQGFDEWSFRQPSRSSKKIIKLLAKANSPRATYIGNMTYRLDMSLLHAVIKNNPKISFIFVGPISSIEPEDTLLKTKEQIKKLTRYRNVYRINDTIQRSQLKYILVRSDVAIIPYNTSFDFNKYCFPMKMFEYFYTGKPIISTSIEELNYYSNYIHIGDTPTFWQKHISKPAYGRRALSIQKMQRALAIKNSWSQKITKILRYLE